MFIIVRYPLTFNSFGTKWVEVIHSLNEEIGGERLRDRLVHAANWR